MTSTRLHSEICVNVVLDGATFAQSHGGESELIPLSSVAGVPGTRAVPCPPGVEGCVNGKCEGLGHATCAGGTLPLNAFGTDFQRTGYQWTEELCRKDSDGDGWSNGVELGDPCCLFPGDSVFLYEDEPVPISHPGYNSSTPADELSPLAYMSESELDAMCADYRARKKDAVKFEYYGHRNNPYAEGEPQLTLTLKAPTYSVPMRGTDYKCSYFDLTQYPELDPSQSYHLVGYRLFGFNMKMTHHITVSSVPDALPKGLSHNSVVENCYIDKAFASGKLLGGWSPGGWGAPNGVVMLPEEAGFAVLGEKGLRYLSLQSHYTNPSYLPGELDTISMELYLTTKLREYDAGVLRGGPVIGQVVSDREGIPLGASPFVIPPEQPRWEIASDCIIQDPITIISTRVHGHMVMKTTWLEVERAGKAVVKEEYKAKRPAIDGLPWGASATRFGGAEVFDYNLQPMILLPDPVKVLPGDNVRTHCVFNTENVNTTVYGGVETADEMCVSYTFYYPEVPDFPMACIEWTNMYEGPGPAPPSNEEPEDEKVSEFPCTLGNLILGLCD